MSTGRSKRQMSPLTMLLRAAKQGVHLRVRFPDGTTVENVTSGDTPAVEVNEWDEWAADRLKKRQSSEATGSKAAAKTRRTASGRVGKSG